MTSSDDVIITAVALERPGHQVALCKRALTSAIAKIDEKLQQQSDDKLIARRRLV